VKRVVAFLIPLLFLFPQAFSDGIILPPVKVKTFDFSAVQEKQQYAVIEVLSNYFERINLFVSLTSRDYKPYNATLVIPLVSVPTSVNAKRISPKEFLRKYKFDIVEKEINRKSFRALVKNTTLSGGEKVKTYLLLSAFSPLWFFAKEFSKGGGMIAPYYGRLEVQSLGKAGKAGIVHIKRFEFEGGYLDVYRVNSSSAFSELVREIEGRELPDNVKRAIEKYKTYYAAVLHLEVSPIDAKKYRMLETYAPNTLKKVINYIETHPDIKLECYGYRCDERTAVMQNFRGFLTEAANEARSRNGIIKSVRNMKVTGDALLLIASEGEAVIYFGNRGIKWVGFGLRSHEGWSNGYIEVYASSDGRNWEKVLGEYFGFSGYRHFNVNVSKFSSNLYLKIKIAGYSPALGGRLEVANLFETNKGVIRVFDERIFNVQEALTDLILAAYTSNIKGMEVSIELPIEGKVYYPLGTGMAWSTPIEDTRIMLKLDKSLEAGVNAHYMTTVGSIRYYLWKFKNWNPDYDIVGEVRHASFLTHLIDSIHELIGFLNDNIGIVSWVYAVSIIAISPLVVVVVERRMFKKEVDRKVLASTYLILFLSPLTSLWIALIAPFVVRGEVKRNEAIELLKVILKSMGIMIVLALIGAVVGVI